MRRRVLRTARTAAEYLLLGASFMLGFLVVLGLAGIVLQGLGILAVSRP